MGIYLNPGNEEFARILRTEFVDKTGLIEIINKSIDTKDNLICISRPGRFGKSYVAQMLCAYYDCDCDSKNLFSGLNISSFVDHEKFINKYNVLYIDVTGFISELTGNKESLSAVTSFIKNSLIQDINRDLPEDRRADNISDCLLNLVE